MIFVVDAQTADRRGHMMTERARLVRQQCEAATSSLPAERLESMDIYVIIGMLPYWCGLGRVLNKVGTDMI
jgi:hypothetical protein